MRQAGGNLLLAAAAATGWSLPRAGIEVIELTTGEHIDIVRDGVGMITFVDDGIVSLVIQDEAGRSAEVGTVGREGLVGLPLLLGATRTPYTSFVQIPGRARRVDLPTFQGWMAETRDLRDLMDRYVYLRLLLSYQNAACNALHTAEQRVARWLLTTASRVGTTFLLKQDYLAMMLGVRRATISVICNALKTRGLIDYSRGMIAVHDIAGLTVVSCSCYRALEEHYQDLVGGRSPAI